MLPGIGPVATIAMLLPVTFNLPPIAALIMLAGIYYGAQYGGSTTAILVNMPGESSSVVTCLDGYQMARQGRAGPALAIAAIGSFFAGCVATLRDRAVRAAARGGRAEVRPAGILLADGAGPGRRDGAGARLAHQGDRDGDARPAARPGRHRRQLGRRCASPSASRSSPTASASSSVAMGMFGIAEIIANLEQKRAPRGVHQQGRASLMPTKEDFKRMLGADPARHRARLVRSASCPAAARCSPRSRAYTLEKKVSKHSHEFGKGAIEGVAAPESANNAGAQTSFIPLLTLGIPSNAVMALMIGAMMIQGIAPGPQVMTEQPQLFWGMIASMWVGNLMLVVLNLPLIGMWIKLLTVPYRLPLPVDPAVHARSACSASPTSPFDVLPDGAVRRARLRLRQARAASRRR